MRPSDENQHGTTRPNLMSSARRGGNSDDSILAKMDRARGPSSRARGLWLAAAGAVIALLIATIGALAYSAGGKPRELPLGGVSASLPPPGSFDMPHSAAPARIINDAPRDDASTAPAPLPPLVILPRAPLAMAPPPAPVYAPTPAPRAPSPTPAVHAVAIAPKAPAPQARPATPPMPRPAPAFNAGGARASTHVAAVKKAKPPAIVADRPEAPPIDLDVALISAVVASRHRAEQASCADGTKCPPTP